MLPPRTTGKMDRVLKTSVRRHQIAAEEPDLSNEILERREAHCVEPNFLHIASLLWPLVESGCGARDQKG